MGFRYAVIGSGRQGTSAAYDLVRFGDAEYLLLADQSLAQADRAAARVNQLIGRQVAHAVQVEVQNEDAVVSMLTGAAIEVLISGVPYFYNLGLTRAALRAHASMCDFGGNQESFLYGMIWLWGDTCNKAFLEQITVPVLFVL